MEKILQVIYIFVISKRTIPLKVFLYDYHVVP